jgi:transcriptional regulator with XRE-family HTH domain
MTQHEVAAKAGMSQSRVSEMERGGGVAGSIETWSCVAAAVGEQFVGFLEHAPGATAPRDIEHLRRQSALIELTARGGWTALPELAI